MREEKEREVKRSEEQRPSGERPGEGREYVEQERGEPAAGQNTRAPGEGFYTTKPTVGGMRLGTEAYSTTPGVAGRPIDEELSKELGVPVGKRGEEEAGASKRQVLVERSDYERLPHEPIGPGIEKEGEGVVERDNEGYAGEELKGMTV